MRATILGLAAGVLLLTGCAAQAEELARTYVHDDPDYQKYLEWQEKDSLDENGYYQNIELEEMKKQADTQMDGSLEVTFGENNKLSISYYYDAAMTQEIDPYNCWLNPGDSIYAAEAVSREDHTDLYALDHYRIYTYDADGQLLESYETEWNVEGLIYQIPESFQGSGVSVMPVGAYAPHSLMVETYFVDADGKKQMLSNAGTWKKNGQTVTAQGIQVDATQQYQLEYELDTENYFFVRSVPEPFHTGNGVVTFPKANPTKALTTYSVELHPYLNLSLQCSQDAIVQRNDQPAEIVKKGKSMVLERLQYGETIIIATTGMCTITDGDYQHLEATADPIQAGKTRYILTVQEQRSGNDAEALMETVQVRRVFTVILESEGKFGTCTYTLEGAPISGTVEIREGQKLEATYTLTDSKYELADLGWWDDLWDAKEQTVEIDIDADVDGQTICGEDWVSVQEKKG